MVDFVHLHVHTQYSLLDGQCSIKKMVDKAINDGMKGIAITDHGNMFGVKELFDYCNKVNKGRKKEGLEPFKPIFGCEMYVAPRSKEDKNREMGDNKRSHLVVLAKNEQGYRNLTQLVSRAWTDGFYNKPRTDHADLERFREGLIVCSACIAGEVPRHILNGNIEKAEETLLWYKSVFGDDYYLELQRHEVKDPGQRANRETFPLQQRANEKLIELAHKHGIKLICSNDVHFIDQENAEAHDILICLSTSRDLDDPKRMLYSKQEWLKTRAEMEDIFSDIPEALTNTMEVLSKVETYDLESNPIMPFFPIPEDFGTEEEWRGKFSEEQLYHEFTTDEYGQNPLSEAEGTSKIKKLGGYEKLYRIKFEADYLGKLGYEGASRLYGTGYTEIEADHALQPDELSVWAAEHGISKEVDERIRFELHIMKTMGFPGYFLIVQDFINSARKLLNVWVGPGRGSAAGSVVAYCLGITKIDPMKYDLLFERFLNPDRISLPDIDTDFDDDGRGKVLKWVMDKYGHENCAHIITYGTLAVKNAIKDVARVLKLPLERANQLCKAIPDRLDGGLKMNLDNCIKTVKELQIAEASANPVEANTIKFARMLEGNIRGTGIHACGFIICRDPISEHVPVSTADDPDFPDTKTAVTQYDGHVIESTGLIKMDFLGLKTLSEMKEACRVIKEAEGVDIDLDNIPIDDELTYKLYQEGRTVGTFQFESPGMRKYLKELHPTVFEDLIAMNALYRPGPMDYIPSFIARKNGREPISYDIPIMEKYLKDTYGITVYQEQVMLLSRLLANFTRGESDALRKAMGKKKKDIVDAMKPKFIEGGKANGHDPKVLEKIWGDWEKFASYAFNKSHAACYSWVAYQTAYIKAHYPAEFMASLLTRRRADIKETAKLLDECKEMGVEVLGPDINESMAHFGVNKNKQIRFGLSAIKGFGDAATEAIIKERTKNGPFKGIFDFVQRVSMNAVKKSGLEVLAISGAFDSFKEIRREQFFGLTAKGETFIETLIRYGNQYQQAQYEAQNSLFGLDAIEVYTPLIPEAEPWGDLERLNREKELIGIYLSAHPLDEYSVVINHLCNLHICQLADLSEFATHPDVLLGGIIVDVKTGIGKRSNLPYGFVTIEDYTGTGELRLFGNDWVRWANYFTIDQRVIIRGTVQPRRYRENELELKIGSVDFLANVKDNMIQSLSIYLPTTHIDPDVITEIDSLTPADPNHHVQLYVHLLDHVHYQRLLLRSHRRIKVSAELIKYLDNNNAGITYKINEEN